MTQFFLRLRSQVVSWFSAIIRRPKLEARWIRRSQFHLEQYAQELIARGVLRKRLERRARLEFGEMNTHRDNMRASRGLRLWDELRSDLRYAFRVLRKSPAFTAIAVLSLALGIGANTTMFTLAKELLFERLSVPNPQQLRLFSWQGVKHVAVHHVWGDWNSTGNGDVTSTSFSYPIYLQLRQQNKVLEDLFAFKDIGRVNATIDGSAEVMQAEMVSGNYYQQLGIEPQLGRAIGASDDAPASGAVAIISDGLWARRFGRSPDVIGKTISVNLTPITIIGVNPRGFTGAKNVQSSPDIFFPFSVQPLVIPRQQDGSLLTSPKLWWVLIEGRAKPGVTTQQAQASLAVALDNAVRSTITVEKDESLPRLVLGDGSRGLNYAGKQFAKPIYVLMSLVGFVLLLACANIANLLLARWSARQREMSVRMALGAGRGRILRQVLTESLLLSTAGGALGLLFSYLGRNVVPRMMENAWEHSQLDMTFDWRVFAFTAAITIVTGLLFGMAPAWQATHAEVNADLKESAQTITHRRKGYFGKSIVGFQVMLSTVLVIGAVLFLRTLLNLVTINPGFRSANILLFDIEQPASRYPAGKDIALHRQIEEKLAAVPGVEAVTLSNPPLVANNTSNSDFVPDGEKADPSKNQVSDEADVGQSFFSTMGIPILAGRGFNAGDTETSPKVAVVNQALARQFFGGANPVGKTFATDGRKNRIEIVGLCGDIRYDSLRGDPPPIFFLPYRQLTQAYGLFGMTYEVKTRIKPESITPLIKNAVQSIDHDLPLIDVRTQDQQIAATMQQELVFAKLTSGFGILALLLACIGIYGIMAYTVARRTNEIGIRLALGAQTGQVRWMVLREASWMAMVGVVFGVGIALLLARLVASMLYGLRPTDPPSLLVSAFLLFAVAVLSAWVPATRASRVQPMDALRHE